MSYSPPRYLFRRFEIRRLFFPSLLDPNQKEVGQGAQAAGNEIDHDWSLATFLDDVARPSLRCY
jgi:hypothetical protein